MGTFGTNRIYSVGRMVKVADRMRSGFVPRGFDSLRISMQNSLRISNTKFITKAPDRQQVRVVVGLFEEEEERTGVASDVVKVQGEDSATQIII